MFEEWDIQGLPEDPLEAAQEICKTIMQRSEQRTEHDQIIDDYEEYLNAYALLETFLDAHDLRSSPPRNIVVSNIDYDVNNIVEFAKSEYRSLKQRSAKSVVAAYKQKYSQEIGGAFLYEFTDGDLKKVQTLLNELRDLVVKADDLSEEHRSRILARLERVQSELHKKVSDLDRFWGLVGDAGVVFGKLATDAKPIVDRVKQIVEIIWKTQSRAEELPSDSKPPLLSTESDENR